jgi:HEAT repeat protein
MQTAAAVILGLGVLLADHAGASAPELDLAHLREVLEDRQDPRGQTQAALLLVQSHESGAARVVHQGLRHPENEEMFLALAAAVRLRQDSRFLDDLLTALIANRPRLRQVVAETLAALPEPSLVKRLQVIAADPRAGLRVRQTAVWTLGRCGRKQAAGVLVGLLSTDNEELRRVVAGALTELTGQNHGHDEARWKHWWDRHKDLTAEQWLEMRLAFQTSRATRLEGELMRARAQLLRLHQHLYSRMPVAERLLYLQAVLDQEDPGVRALAIVWTLELLPAADAERRKLLAGVLLRLTHDSVPEVQRAAVLALGRVSDAPAYERLMELLGAPASSVRAAAARALAGVARGSDSAARTRQKAVIPALQKALEDRALEVVVEAAEALGTLGAPEAGPVLTGLLRHPSEHVRQTAAQALERTADASLLEGLLKGLDDPNVTVRFCLLGALARASVSQGGQTLSAEQRKRLLDRLEGLMKRDAELGVRSRAATVLGECATPAFLPTLWGQVQAGGEARVQEKAWDAFAEIIVRSGNPAVLEQWDRKLADARQASRRVQLLARVFARWDQLPEGRPAATRALEMLVQAQIDLGKWSAAAPLAQNLLARSSDPTLRARCLKALLKIGEMALREGNRAETLRLVLEARPYLSPEDRLTEAFDRLEKQASGKE